MPVMEGYRKNEIAREILVHANQELNPTILVANRIIQLGETPVRDPKDWSKLDNCSFEVQEDPFVITKSVQYQYWFRPRPFILDSQQKYMRSKPME